MPHIGPKTNEKLEEKCSELKEVEIRNTILVIKERRRSEEIEEACEELVTVYIIDVLESVGMVCLCSRAALFFVMMNRD